LIKNKIKNPLINYVYIGFHTIIMLPLELMSMLYSCAKYAVEFVKLN